MHFIGFRLKLVSYTFYYTYVADSGTVDDDVTYHVVRRIYNPNLPHSDALFTLSFE